MIKIKNIFPINENEQELIKFMGRFQYLLSKDAKYFFNDTYYPKRIKRLVNNKILRRYKRCLMLAENGYSFLQMSNQKIVHPIYNKNYVERLKFLSHLSAIYYHNEYIKFTPSYEIKDKNVYTETSRRYMGVLNIFGTKYLTYHISKNNSKQYISAIMFDIQKENKYKNIIILIDDISRIDFNDFTFGLNSVIICEDTDEKLEQLKYIQQINWSKIIQKNYKEKVHLSEYNFCDYTDNEQKYITTFYLIDTEKINRINNFTQNNLKKHAEIICTKEIAEILR